MIDSTHSRSRPPPRPRKFWPRLAALVLARRRRRPAGQSPLRLRAAADRRRAHLQRAADACPRSWLIAAAAVAVAALLPLLIAPAPIAQGESTSSCPASRAMCWSRACRPTSTLHARRIRRAISAGAALQARSRAAAGSGRASPRASTRFPPTACSARRAIRATCEASISPIRSGCGSASSTTSDTTGPARRRAPRRPRPPLLDGLAPLAAHHALVRDGPVPGRLCRREVCAGAAPCCGRAPAGTTADPPRRLWPAARSRRPMSAPQIFGVAIKPDSLAMTLHPPAGVEARLIALAARHAAGGRPAC